MAKKSPNSSGAALRILAVSLIVATILVFWSSVVNLDHTQGLFLIAGLLFPARWLGEPRATWIALGALLVGVSCSIRMAHLVIGCLLLLT